MDTRTVISVNPASAPSATQKTKVIFRHVEKPVRIMQRTLCLLFGIGGSARHCRRLWTFRVIIGSIIMCFGLMFTHSSLHAATDAILPGMSYAMIAGGAMIACGLLTRAVSVAMGAVMIIATFHAGVPSMEGYATATCAAMCMMSLVCGSGRYSLDTLLYNALTPMRKQKVAQRGCSSLRRMCRNL